MFQYRHWNGLLCIAFIINATICLAGKPGGRNLVEQSDPNRQYQILMATFGNQLEDESAFNVMLPPDDRNLCNFPNLTRINSTKEEIEGRINSISQPIAFLVPRASPCSNQRRAEVLLQMQREISSMLKMLIVYEEEPRYMGYFLLLKPDEEPAPEELNGISIAYLPFLELREFARRMDGFAEGDNMYFLHHGNEEWSYIHTVEGEWEPVGVNDRDGRSDRSTDYYGRDDYDWIRYALFSLLIVSPCIRAVYLFYAGGGRIHLRRNQTGTVVGLQYIPPMPYWLSHGRPPRPTAFSSETLTEVQFNDLPEIIYEPVQGEDGIAVSSDVKTEDESNMSDCSSEMETDVEMGDKKDSSEASGIAAAAVSAREKDTSPGPSLAVISDGNDIYSDSDDLQHNASAQQAISTLKTICTECSICIDDFEVGERLTILPRCRHAFHKDCIKPWLLERQGCCPLCKMCVLPEDSIRTSSEQETDNS